MGLFSCESQLVNRLSGIPSCLSFLIFSCLNSAAATALFVICVVINDNLLMHASPYQHKFINSYIINRISRKAAVQQASGHRDGRHILSCTGDIVTPLLVWRQKANRITAGLEILHRCCFKPGELIAVITHLHPKQFKHPCEIVTLYISFVCMDSRA